MPLIEKALDRYLAPRVPPIIEVRPSGNGYGVFKCGYAVKRFIGPSARAEAWEYGESLLDDLRYENERAA